jgi:hypothetical protein
MTLEQFIAYLQGLLYQNEVPENTRIYFIDVHEPKESVQNLAIMVDEKYGLSIYNTS